MIDIGLNITSKQFNNDKEEIIKTAIKNGIYDFIFTGTSLENSLRSQQFIKDNNIGYFTAGLHPHNAKDWIFYSENSTYNKIKKMSSDKKLVAIGECGLDYDRMFSPKEIQIKVLEEHFKLALELNLPVFLHLRAGKNGEAELMKDFEKSFKPFFDKGIRGIVHCFTGSGKMLNTLVNKYNLSIGITGWVCDDRRGKELQSIIKFIPNDKLMIETDAPFLTPKNVPNLDRRNVPANLVYVLKKIAEIKKITPKELENIVDKNTKEFFNLGSNEIVDNNCKTKKEINTLNVLSEMYKQIIHENSKDDLPNNPKSLGDGNETEDEHLLWMLNQIMNDGEQSETKKYRWLGFVQGTVISKKYTTVVDERNNTRDILNGK